MRSEGNCRIDPRPLSAKEVVMLGLREILTERQKKQIFQSAIVLLEKIGYLCNHDETLGYFREAGCRIGRELDKPRKARRVLFTEEIVADALEKAPSGFAIYPTSPGYEKLEFLSGKSYFVSQGGDYVWDYRTHELRPARAHDHVAMSRLIDACDNIEGCFPAVYWFYDLVPQDQYDRYGIWDIFMSLECLHCGKPKFDVYSTATATEVPTFLRTWQLCAGGEDAFRAKPCGSLFIAPTSPFFLEGRIDPEDPWGHADSLVLMAKAGAPINIEPCGNLGMSGPVTVAGLVAQSIAEFLGMNVAIQSISPGNPVMMNDYTGSIDMATGQKQEVRPEANLVHLGLTEMTHYMGVPISTVNCSGSIEADAQVGWESMAIILSQYLAEHLGRSGGYAKEKGGHFCGDKEYGVLPVTLTVGGTFPIALGAGIAAENADKGQVVLSIFGEGAAQRGTLHECMNMASVWKLPLIWVCENNLYYITTHAEDSLAVEDVSEFAHSYAMPGVTVDGMDVMAVAEQVVKALERAREGQGPSLIECKTYRYREHGEFDIDTSYRTKEEVEAWNERDPILAFRKHLIEEGVAAEEELEALEKKIVEEVRAAAAWALENPFPDASEACTDQYAG
jgi:TPP-dependent pyruvate/acetoin dehydrogenase alpha subunit